jgi:hypothetical protein
VIIGSCDELAAITNRTTCVSHAVSVANIKNVAAQGVFYTELANPLVYDRFWSTPSDYKRGYQTTGLVAANTQVQAVKIEQNTVTFFTDWFSSGINTINKDFY